MSVYTGHSFSAAGSPEVSMSSITSLPQQIVAAIVELLATDDLYSFIRVCCRFFDIGIRRLHHLALTFRPLGRDSTFEWACENGQLSLVKALLDLGVDRFLGVLGLDWALEAAAIHGHTDVVRFILLETPESVIDRLPGSSIAEDADIPHRHFLILRLLLWNGAKSSALYDAISSNDEKTVREFKGTVDLYGQPGSHHRLNPVHVAAKRGHESMIKLLFEFPACNETIYACDVGVPRKNHR